MASGMIGLVSGSGTSNWLGVLADDMVPQEGKPGSLLRSFGTKLIWAGCFGLILKAVIAVNGTGSIGPVLPLAIFCFIIGHPIILASHDHYSKIYKSRFSEIEKELREKFSPQKTPAELKDPSYGRLLDRARNGDINAQVKLGKAFHKGICVPKDDKRAFYWMHQAADQGFPDAQYFLGWAYDNGCGVAKSRDEAKEWLKLAAEQGHKHSIEKLKEWG